MGTYNPIERRIAGLLKRFPTLKRNLKFVYQYSNYLAFGDQKFTAEVHPSVSISTPAAWFDTKPQSDELFYGYFDTTPWNQSMEYGVYQHLSPDQSISIQLYGERECRPIATTDAWNYQQGSRLQWHPTENDRILFNDIQDGDLISHLVTIDGKDVNRFDRPIQAIAPTGNEFISLNYHRLEHNRPDYGYGVADETQLSDPTKDGLWRIDFEDGSRDLVISLSDLIHNSVDQKKHYLNHVLYNPTGDRFVFLHRWHGTQGRTSRLYLSSNTEEPLLDWPTISHYCWIDNDKLLVWGISEESGSGYYAIDVSNRTVSQLGGLEGYGDGHPSISPNGRWVVTDTYPDRARQRHLLLYDLEENTEIELGQFFAPLTYRGVDRCDLHPRWSPDGTLISFDSTHEGARKSYILDVSELVD